MFKEMAGSSVPLRYFTKGVRRETRSGTHSSESRYRVFGEKVTDTVTDVCDLEGKRYLAVEYLPGQFDQRAASAEECVHLIEPTANIRIRSSRLMVLNCPPKNVS